jgi:hypothetical protein
MSRVVFHVRITYSVWKGDWEVGSPKVLTNNVFRG